MAKIREFSTLSNQAKERFPAIAGDFYRSCLRRVQYVPVSPLPSSEEPTIAISSDLGEVNNPGSTVISEEPLAQRIELKKRFCDGKHPEQELPDLQEIGPHFTRINGVVVSYVEKLGLVADPNLTNLDAEFDTLGASANNVASSARGLFLATQQPSVPNTPPAVISPEQLTGKVDAVVNIFGFVTELFMEGERREVLETMIVGSNADFQEVLDSLELIVDNFYIKSLLRAEEAALDQTYQEYITALETSDTFRSGSDVISVTNHLISLDNSWNEKKELIQSRRELAQAYIGVLDSLSGGHTLLFEIFTNGETPTEQQVQSIVDENSAALKNFIDKSKALNNKEIQ
ncbi:MAG: hypothetical protein ACFB4I_17640 [Cyanophyceae cyanobacterium]